MKKWKSTIYYGSCFIAAMLIEAYSIQILEGNLYVTAGVGIGVLITGYLFMDSIRSAISQSSEDTKFYVDHLLNEEAEKWNERYTELMNLTKASYTATKKNAVISSEQYEAVLTRLEELENNNAKALQRITELQKKALEGQKNALNLEINYSKENMKHLVGIIRDEDKNSEMKEKVNRILELLEKNNELLEAPTKNASETGLSFAEGPESEAEYLTGVTDPTEIADTAEDNLKVTPLYDDPNKSLTADEIAALFASIGK